jgi:hypothetical protein
MRRCMMDLLDVKTFEVGMGGVCGVFWTKDRQCEDTTVHWGQRIPEHHGEGWNSV